MALASKEVLALSDGRVVATINGKNYTLIEASTVSAKVSVNKESVNTLGNRMTGHIPTSAEGTGSLKTYYVNSMWADVVQNWKEKGIMPDISITGTMESTRGSIGKQTVRLYGVIPDEISLFDIEAGDGVIEDEWDFTFEDFKIIDQFKALSR
jgi:hypothetical protein